jgi:hypothetical protein
MKIRLLLPLVIASLGTARAVTPPTAFIAYPSLAKTGYSARGATDIAFSTLGLGAISPADEVIFETRLIGAGTSFGRTRAMFAYRGSNTDPTLFSGASFGLGLPTGTKFSAFLNPIHNRSVSSAIFQATISGPGISSTNNRVILQDDGFSISSVSRTGVALAALSGAIPIAYKEVLQQEGANDRIALNYTLKRVPGNITAANDSGLLLMSHSGTVTHFTAREGLATYPLSGAMISAAFGQFNRASILNSTSVGFIAKMIPTGAKPVDAIFQTGSNNERFNPIQGTTPLGFTAGELYSTFTGIARIGTVALLRANLTRSPTASNQGVWNSGGTLLLRKGQPIGSTTVAKILRIWGLNNNQLVAQVQLSNRAQALILRQIDGTFVTLISTLAQAPDFISGIDIATFQAIDVDPVNGYFVVLGSLKGVGSSENQALWIGKATLGSNDSQLADRIPVLQLQKGSIFFSTNTPTNTVRSISLRPAIDPTGVGARGFAQQISSTGRILVTVTGDRGIKELLVLN